MGEYELQQLSAKFITSKGYYIQNIVETLAPRNGLTKQAYSNIIGNGFMKDIKIFENPDKLSRYLANKTVKKEKMNYFEEFMYWFVTTVYLVDMTTTKSNLIKRIKEDVKKYYR